MLSRWNILTMLLLYSQFTNYVENFVKCREKGLNEQALNCAKTFTSSMQEV